MLSTLKPGTVVDSRYEIVEHIGDGGMGSVFKARELGLDRVVALKMLHPSLVGDMDHQERFKREGAILSKLEHSQILQCYRFGVWNDRFPYIAMEYIQGKSLSSLIGENGRLEPARVIALGKQICSAMEHAHRQGIIHRDLKPANIMVANDGSSNESAKILDFGLARVVSDGGRANQLLTRTGELIGSVYYMSPEQCLGKPCNVASDVYSLGCLLYEALTGLPPLMAETPVALMYLHANSCPELISRKLPQVDLPAGLDALIARCLEKDSARRFQSMKQLESDLDLIGAGRGAAVSSVSVPGEQQMNSKQGLVAVFFVAGILGLITVGLAVALKSRAPMVEAYAVRNSKYSEKVVPRHLDLSDFYYSRSMDRLEKISKIREWLKKYGGIDLQGQIIALTILGNIYFDGCSDDDKKQRDYCTRQLSDALTLLNQETTAVRGVNTAEMERTMQTVVDALCQERGPLVGRETFLRDYAKMTPDNLKDSVNRAMADIFSSSGLYTEEMSRRRKVLYRGLQDQILYRLCLYRQRKFAEAKETVCTFSPGAYADHANDFQHRFAQTFLEMNMIPEATASLALCASQKHALSSVMMRATGRARNCDNPSTHARMEALILNLGKDYRGAHSCLVNAMASAPAKELQWYRQVLWPLVVRNAEQGHLDLSALLDGAMNQASIGDIGWMLAVASTCRKTNQSLADRLLTRCMQIIEINRRKAPSCTRWATVVAAAQNAAGRPAAGLELLMNALPHVRDERAALWMHIVLAKSLLDLGKLDESEHHLLMVRSELYSELTKNEVDRLVLHLRAQIARARGKLPESCVLFEQLRKLICNNATLGIEEKIQILEDYAKTCRLMKQTVRARELEMESQVLLPDECRGPWRTWRPLLERHRISFSPQL